MSKDRQVFYDASLQYVFKIQEVQERKKFEFVEPVSSYTYIMIMFMCNFSMIQVCILWLGHTFWVVIRFFWAAKLLRGKHSHQYTTTNHRKIWRTSLFCKQWCKHRVITPAKQVMTMCVHVDMIMERQLSPVLEKTHYTHCLAVDKNVLMMDISRAHFLLL